MSKKSALSISSNPYLLIMLVLLTACAPTKNQIAPPMNAAIPIEASSHPKNMSWWACKFKISWDSDTLADSGVDLLLAHAVVKPVLKAHANELILWRFHRRAVRDRIGHQFSFFFYTAPGVATEVMEELRQSDILNQALAENILEKIIFEDSARLDKPQIEDMSDPHWSLELQRNWPFYIMGVSALWLGLIDEEMADVTAMDSSLSGVLEQYRQADTAITSIWREEGQHAFLHHLNAIFGYEPLLIRKEIIF